MKVRSLLSSCRLIIYTILIIAMLPVQVFAKSQSKISSNGPDDPRELKEFMDGFFTYEMNRYNIPGAVISIIKDGKVFYQRGYGYANLEKKIPVTPEETVFRIGSVSKLFTATAVMQLKEQGKIDLEKDVNEYLTYFKVQQKYSKPITMHNLLTHTAGFDDQVTGMEAEDHRKLIPLGKYLAENMPQRIREPGILAQYSNHGIALAGYIVEEVSGMPFKKYLEGNIFKPIGMDSTYARLSEEMLDNLALEYSYRNGAYEPMKLYDFNIYPAGSICSTASDMSKFMIAHLNNGNYEEARILKKETAVDMHSKHFTHDSILAGMCYGFFEIKKNTHRFIAHGGDTNGSHSFLLLDPKENLGMFVSTNGSNGHILTSDLIDDFIDIYYPMVEDTPNVMFVTNMIEDNKRIEGEYRPIRYSRNTLDKLSLLLTPYARIDVKGNVLVYTDSRGTENYIQAGPLIFRNTKNGQFIVFEEEASEDISYMYTEVPVYAMEKVKWYESNKLHTMLLCIFIIIFLSYCIYFLTAYSKGSNKRKLPQGRYADRIAAAVCALNIIFFLGMAGQLLSLGTVSEIAYMLPLPMKILLISQLLAAFLTAVLVAASIAAWIKGYWHSLKCICFTILAFAGVGFTAIMFYYNLIGIKY